MSKINESPLIKISRLIGTIVVIVGVTVSNGVSRIVQLIVDGPES